MSGGKGGGSTSKVEIPQWAEDATKKNLARSEAVQRMGYMPYMGPDVAAFNPMQVAAMQSAADAGSAFGLAPQMNVSSMIPEAQTYAGGIQGYSSFPMFEQSVGAARDKFPEQMGAYDSLQNPYQNKIGMGAADSPLLPPVPQSDINQGGYGQGSGMGFGMPNDLSRLQQYQNYTAPNPFNYEDYFSAVPQSMYDRPEVAQNFGGGRAIKKTPKKMRF